MKKIAVLIGAVLLWASTAMATTTTGTTTVYVPMVPAAAATETETTAPFDWTKPGTFVVVVQLGAYGPTDDDKDYDLFNPQTGFAGAVAIGYRFNQLISGQLEVGYQQSEGEYDGWSFDAIPAMATVHLGIPVDKKFEVYALGGIGALFYNVEDISNSSDEVAMATKLGLGLTFHFGKYSVGGEVAYQMTNISDAPNDAMMAFVTIGYGH